MYNSEGISSSSVWIWRDSTNELRLPLISPSQISLLVNLVFSRRMVGFFFVWALYCLFFFVIRLQIGLSLSYLQKFLCMLFIVGYVMSLAHKHNVIRCFCSLKKIYLSFCCKSKTFMSWCHFLSRPCMYVCIVPM